jgi:[ribosomal protein S5]-alanine N-acetyltransferase
MILELATAEHIIIFTSWRQGDRLEEQTCRPVHRGQRVPTSNEYVVLAFFIEEIDEPVGKFTYFDFNSRNQSAEFGYTVNPKFRNCGIGTSMLVAAINRLFSTTNLNKLYCQTAAFNIPSIKLIEKLHFHRDGVLREHHELDGKLWDDYIYSILRREWLKQ